MPFDTDLEVLAGVAALLDNARALFEAAAMVLPDPESQDALAAAAAIRGALCLRLRDEAGFTGPATAPALSEEDLALCQRLSAGDHDAARRALCAGDKRLRAEAHRRSHTEGLSAAACAQLRFAAQMLDVSALALPTVGVARAA